jgi:hypothetical protein
MKLPHLLVALQTCNYVGSLNMLTYPRSQERDLGHPAVKEMEANPDAELAPSVVLAQLQTMPKGAYKGD